jgi:hypothetical protein
MLLALMLTGNVACAETALRDGDIIFHTSRSAQSAGIQRATHSRYSHVGLVLYREGARQKLREFDLSDPAVKTRMRERYGTRVPLEEPVISPGSQFESPLLETVVSR